MADEEAKGQENVGEKHVVIDDNQTQHKEGTSGAKTSDYDSTPSFMSEFGMGESYPTSYGYGEGDMSAYKGYPYSTDGYQPEDYAYDYGEEGEGEDQGEEVGEEENEEELEEEKVDPAAPLDLTESKEAMKKPFKLSDEQMEEVLRLWDMFQNYTPVYADLDQYITVKELRYMMKALLLMTYTESQLQELIAFCCKPKDPEGKITFDQFLRMVTMRQRDYDVEEELRDAMRVLDPGRTGEVDLEEFKELLTTVGHKMPYKKADAFIKEVCVGGEDKINIEDVVGTMAMDIKKDDFMPKRANDEEETEGGDTTGANTERTEAAPPADDNVGEASPTEKPGSPD